MHAKIDGKTIGRVALVTLSALLIAALCYVPVAYLSYQIMGLIFGSSGGHPPVANAPEWVYWLVFAGGVPLVGFGIGLLGLRAIGRLFRRR